MASSYLTADKVKNAVPDGTPAENFFVVVYDGDNEDTYGADARLLEFDIHYQIDAGGSVGEFSK